MPRLNVRCCCQPQKILGTLEVPNVLRNYIVVRERFELKTSSSAASFVDEPVKTYQVEIRTLVTGNGREHAIYSDDRPIEFWRKIIGFREDVVKGG